MSDYPPYVVEWFEKHGRQCGGRIGNGDYMILADHEQRCMYVYASRAGESRRFDGEDMVAEAKRWLQGFGGTLQ